MPDPYAAILEASYRGDTERVGSLLRNDPQLARLPGTPERWEGATPLSLAALGGHLEVAELLLAAGAGVNPSAHDGSSLLMAAWGMHVEMVRLLLDHGANPNVASASGETPLMAAAYKGALEIARLLIEHGADVNAQTTSGTTDFFNGSPPVCGETPLHLAAAYGHREVVELLLAHGADRDRTDHCGQTALHWAARHRQDGLLALLRGPRSE